MFYKQHGEQFTKQFTKQFQKTDWKQFNNNIRKQFIKQFQNNETKQIGKQYYNIMETKMKMESKTVMETTLETIYKNNNGNNIGNCTETVYQYIINNVLEVSKNKTRCLKNTTGNFSTVIFFNFFFSFLVKTLKTIIVEV